MLDGMTFARHPTVISGYREASSSEASLRRGTPGVLRLIAFEQRCAEEKNRRRVTMSSARLRERMRRRAIAAYLRVVDVLFAHPAKVARFRIDLLERRYAELVQERRDIFDCMREERFDGSPESVIRVASSVSAMEIRVAARPRIRRNLYPFPVRDRTIPSDAETLRDSSYSTPGRTIYRARRDWLEVWRNTYDEPLSVDESSIPLDSACYSIVGSSRRLFTAPRTSSEREGRRTSRARPSMRQNRAQRDRALIAKLGISDIPAMAEN